MKNELMKYVLHWRRRIWQHSFRVALVASLIWAVVFASLWAAGEIFDWGFLGVVVGITIMATPGYLLIAIPYRVLVYKFISDKRLSITALIAYWLVLFPLYILLVSPPWLSLREFYSFLYITSLTAIAFWLADSFVNRKRC
ncbi:hypothetical protein A374_16974 [Fictibacillus macauensis ZFHKF-1]|uniref:Uncharacterized protein n=1 Tax=Fictibacillus macauensis ZFHKF-1 TaxID=1196324 RepID=I8UAZ2_9BACL|nr:hypothetical protein [Fictibacillus macauensis]EIT84095.1 hypothetical protein A374_16974 [Fictibacillus macauensis ZFHKF-1]